MSRESMRKGVAEWRNGPKYWWPMWWAWSKGNLKCCYILILVIRVFVMYKLNIRPISFSTSLYSKDFETDLNSKHGHISFLPLWYCIYVSMETCVHLRGRAEVVMAHVKIRLLEAIVHLFQTVVLSSVVHLYSTQLNTGKAETVWGPRLYYLSSLESANLKYVCSMQYLKCA